MAVLELGVTIEKEHAKTALEVEEDTDLRRGRETDIPDSAANLGLVLREVDVLEDHVLAVAHVVLVILVAEVTAVGLAVIESRTSVLSVVLELLVDHRSVCF